MAITDRVKTIDFDATELGLLRASLTELLGGNAEENAEITLGILRGEIGGPKRDAVLLNAAFALSTECGDLPAGLAEARASLESGAALRTMQRYVEMSRSFA